MFDRMIQLLQTLFADRRPLNIKSKPKRIFHGSNLIIAIVADSERQFRQFIAEQEYEGSFNTDFAGQPTFLEDKTYNQLYWQHKTGWQRLYGEPNWTFKIHLLEKENCGQDIENRKQRS